MSDATERSGSLAAVYRSIKTKDGQTALRIDKNKAIEEANKMAKGRNSQPRNNKSANQTAGSSKPPKKSK